MLRRWEAGDDGALEELIRIHYPYVRDLVRRHMTPRHRARAESMDFVQDTLLSFLRGAPRFHIENHELFRGLLATIVKRRIQYDDRYWSAKRRELNRIHPLPRDTVLDLSAPITNPDERAAKNEEIAYLRFGLEFMKAADRRFLVESIFEGKSYEEIARSEGSSYDAVRMRCHRAKERLGRVIRKLKSGQLEHLVRAHMGPLGSGAAPGHERRDDCSQAGEAHEP